MRQQVNHRKFSTNTNYLSNIFFIGLITVILIVLGTCHLVDAQQYFNVWLTSDTHLAGDPTGSVKSLKLPIKQARGKVAGASSFTWDIQIDAGDWTGSQKPPTEAEGKILARELSKILDKDRGRLFTISGNHDGVGRGKKPGVFFKKYINPLRDPKYFKTSKFTLPLKTSSKPYFLLSSYPGTRWDRYLIRTGNVIWIMLSDRNEFDALAEQRGDTTGRFQAGRGSAAGMPAGGYPSGAVTLETFKWWKKVVENPKFSNCILITVTHQMLPYTTIDSEDGDQGNYHGSTGSIGPHGEVGGELYWIREYNDNGEEVAQYAQTWPFLNYLRDHLGAVSIWIGAHTHVNAPESKIDGRGIYVRKYNVTFLNIGSLTVSHGPGINQMSRMLTFKNGGDVAVLSVYIHKSEDGHPIGWYEPAARKVPLGKKFISPDSTTNMGNLYKLINEIPIVPEASGSKDSIKLRYQWNLNEDHIYDFNNETMVVGAEGSPYGVYQNIDKPLYSQDSHTGMCCSLDLRGTKGRVVLNKPYQPEMDWPFLTLSLWLKTNSKKPQEVISYSSTRSVGKFRLWYDGTAWIWNVGEGPEWKSVRWNSKLLNDGHWHHFVATANSKLHRIQLYIDGYLVGEERWMGSCLKATTDARFVIGASGDPSDGNLMTWSRPFNGLIDEIAVYDTVFSPSDIKSSLVHY